MMLTSRTGMRTSGSSNPPGERGFTLLEVMVVVALIAILLTFVVPRLFRDPWDIERATATLGAQVRFLQAEASASGRLHRLRIGLEPPGSYPEAYDPEEKKFLPAEDVLARPRGLDVERVLQVRTPRGRSEAFLVYPGGFVEPVTIEVEIQGKISTLSVYALTGRVEHRPGRAQR